MAHRRSAGPDRPRFARARAVERYLGTTVAAEGRARSGLDELADGADVAGQRLAQRGASIGLVRKSFMPAASACSRSETSAAAVSAMIGSSLRVVALAQLARGLVAAHHRHLHVHQHRVERPAVGGGRARPPRPPSRPSRACATRTPHCSSIATAIIMLTGLSSTISTRCAAQPLERRSPRRSSERRARRRSRSGSSAQKRAAAPGALSHADLAAHQLRQLAADRQAEAGAAVAPRRRAVALRERLEQALLRRRVDARAGVGHREAHRAAGRRRVASMRTLPRSVNLSALVM